LYAYVGNDPIDRADPSGLCDQRKASCTPPPSPTITARTRAEASGSETVGNIAARINNETNGMHNSKKANQSLSTAEGYIAHMRLNGLKKWGNLVQKIASLDHALRKGSGYAAALRAVEKAVMQDREGIDPTHGSLLYNMRTAAQVKGDKPFFGMYPHTISGPYSSPTQYTYIVTYGPMNHCYVGCGLAR